MSESPRIKQDTLFMERALTIAACAEGATAPNPMVGAVVVQAGTIVGEGYHQHAGGKHAEVLALEAAKDRARGATLYVTLEPCNHHGRTGPCAEAIIEAGIRRVVVASLDPNRAVRGGGSQRLRDAGIAVEHGLLASREEQLNAAWRESLAVSSEEEGAAQE